MSNETTNTTGVRQVFFKMFDEYEENYFRYLNGEQTKALVTALFAFHKTGEIREFDNDPLVAMAYNSICNNMIRDEKNYVNSCRRSAESYARKKAKKEAKKEAKKKLEEQKKEEESGSFTSLFSKI